MSAKQINGGNNSNNSSGNGAGAMYKEHRRELQTKNANIIRYKNEIKSRNTKNKKKNVEHRKGFE